MFYVYKITNLVNGKLYIGKAENVEERWLKHLSHARTNRGFVFHQAINKYGKDNFEVSVIEECELDTEALQKEIYWIAYYKTNICKYGSEFGYNLTDGGEGIIGHHHSDETKQKMSSSSKGKPKSENHKEQLRIAKIGATLSPEHKLNIGKANLGRKHTDLSKKKQSISKTGEKNPQAILDENKVREIKVLFVENLLSNKEISEKYGVAPRTIRDIKNDKTWCHIK